MSDTDQVSTTTTASPGAMLVAAREHKGMSQEQVSAELKIQIKKIRALENDEFHLMFSEVFVRGYLRNYAKLLQIDGEQLVQLYLSAHGIEEPAEPVHDSLNLTINSDSSPWPKRLLLVAVIVLVWLLAYWYFSDQSAAPDALIDNTEAPAPVVTVSQPEPEFQFEPDYQAESVDQAAVVEPISQVEPMPSTESSLDILQLSFAEECWLDVQDANGDVLATDLQTPGSRITLTGVAPFSVRLGNYAQGVSASVNGEAVELPARAASAVVTFQMGSAREAN